MPCRRRLVLPLALALPLLAAAPVAAETEPLLLYEPRLFTPLVERSLVRAKADRIVSHIQKAPAPASTASPMLLPRPSASDYTSATDRRMAARAQASIDAAQTSATRELRSLEQESALADLAESRLWALHALRTFRPDPAAGPEGRQ